MGMPIDEFAKLREQPCGTCSAEAGPDGDIPEQDRTVYCVACATIACEAAKKPCQLPDCRKTVCRVIGTGADETDLCFGHSKAAKAGCTATLFTGPIPLIRANFLAAATR